MNLFDLCVYKNLNKESGGDVDVSSLVATENKTYNAGEGKAYNPVVVNVPTPSPSLQSLTASHNGYFLPSSGYVGFSEVNVDVALPQNAYLLESQKDDVVTIQHGAEFDMPKLIASIEPQQDLHGYDSPWVGGSGKNKLPNAVNTMTVNGITITKNSDGTYTLNGTSTTGNTRICLNSPTGEGDDDYDLSLPNGDYYLSGLSGGTSSTYRMEVAISISDHQSRSISHFDGDTPFTIENNNVCSVSLWVNKEGQTFNNFVISPMIRSTSESPTFEPYENDCPISGWSAVNVVDDAVYGGNVNWNQTVNNFNTPSGTIQGISRIFVTDGEKRGVKILGTATATDNYTVAFIDNTTSHKYFITLGNVTLPTGCALNASYDKTTSIISNGVRSQIFIRITANTSINVTVYPQAVDLTQLFGETKANEIYAMEQAETGSGVAYFKTLFYKDYYPYNSGEITNVSAVNGDTDKYSTYTIDLDGTRYGGTLNVVSGVLSGVLTVDRASITLNGSEGYQKWNSVVIPGLTGFNTTWNPQGIVGGRTTFLCNRLKSIDGVISDNNVYAVNGVVYFCIAEDIIGGNTVADWKNWLSNNNLQLVYELATPQTYQLTPTQVKSLLGVNNIWADTGKVDVQIWTKEVTS